MAQMAPAVWLDGDLNWRREQKAVRIQGHEAMLRAGWQAEEQGWWLAWRAEALHGRRSEA